MIAGLVLGSGCAAIPTVSPRPPVEGLNQNYFPMVPGKQWTYQIHVIDGGAVHADGEIQWRNTSVRQTQMGDETSVQVSRDESVADFQLWLATPKGLYLTAQRQQNKDGPGPLVSFEPPQPVFEYPLKAGSTFHWSGTGPLPDGTAGLSTVNGRIDPVEEVATPCGRLTAIPVEYSIIASGIVSSEKVWFTPGVGIIELSETDKLGKSSPVRQDLVLEDVQ